MGILDFFFKRTLENIEEKTTRSFNNLRTDMASVAKWINHFHQRHENTENEIQELNKTIQNQEKNIENMQEDIKELKKQIYQVQTRFEPRFEPELEPGFEPAKTLQKRHEKKKMIEERILSRIKSKTKEYAINQIVELISESDLSTKELELVVVKDKGLCSRTSFYNYIRELKSGKKIAATSTGLKILS